MGIMNLLFSFSGRVNRLKYWAVEIGLAVATAAILSLLGWQSNPMSDADQAEFKARMDKSMEIAPGDTPTETVPPSQAPAPDAAPAPQAEMSTTDAIMGIAAIAGLMLVGIFNVWISLAMAVKRFHDRDKSGWWALIILVPGIGGLWILIECGFLKGTSGDNRFGADPVAA